MSSIRFRRRLLLAATLLAATVIVLLVTGVLPRRPVASTSPSAAPSDGPTASSPASPTNSPPTASPTASVVPAPTATPPITTGELTWDAIVPPGPFVHDILWDGDRWVAVGTSVEERAAAWTSTDGRVWVAAAPIDPAPVTTSGPTAEAYWMNTVARLGDGLLGGGWAKLGAGDSGHGGVWRSADGGAWAYVDLGYDFDLPFEAVTTDTGGLVVLSEKFLGSVSTIWLTDDGLQWEEADPGLPTGILMKRLAAGGGRLLAIGTSKHAWTSTDGRAWTEVIGPPATDLSAVAFDAVGDRFLVAGNSAAGLALWSTTDGSTWSEPIILSAGSGHVTDVAVDNGLVVATGWRESGPTRLITAWSLAMIEDAAVFQVTLADGTPFVGRAVVEVAGGMAVVYAHVHDSDAPLAWLGQLSPP